MKACNILIQKAARSLAFLAGLGCFIWNSPPQAQAHELWIAPTKPHVAADEPIVANLRIGDMFVGSSMIHLPGQTEQLAMLTGKGMQPLSPRAGTRPVITTDPVSSRHVVLIYESTASYVRYQDGEKFFGFADKKGASWARAEHASRALPADNFVERYSRHTKASISTGGTQQSIDRQTGMEVEFTILSMTSQASRTDMKIQLTYQGIPLPDAALTLFARAPDDSVSISSHRTGPDGTINLPAMTAYAYMLDHVTLRQIDPATDENGAVWESLWASLTFFGPPR